MKTHYELLGVEPTADAEAIKKAFRREIARYHPDKVAHLGEAFQVMAADRAAELTIAYKTLSDAALRAEYDAGLGAAPAVAPAPPRATAAAAADAPSPARADTPAEPEGDGAAAGARMFERERAGRDDIVRRAVLLRLREVLARSIGAFDEPRIRGFDLACVPRAKPSLFSRSVPPRVLVRLLPRVDGDAAAESWTLAARGRVPMIKGAALLVLLLGHSLARPMEILEAVDALERRRPPGTPSPLFVVPVDVRDWSAQVPPGAPEIVTRLLQQLRTFV